MTSRKPEHGQSLADLFPEIAAQAVGWNPKLVFAFSGKKLQWRCEKNHEFVSSPHDRRRGSGCPYCAGNRVLAGFNDLATTHPDLALQAVGWNPKEVNAGSHKRLLWRCGNGHEFSSVVKSRALDGRNCAICSGKKVLAGFNDLATTHPDLALQAVGWNPKEVIAGSGRKVRWRCDVGHEWISTVLNRVSGNDCPSCSTSGFNPSKDAWLYFLNHDEWQMFQIGITNFPDDRIAQHTKIGWTVLEIRGAMDGVATRALERAILRSLKRRGAVFANQNNGKKFDGFTESWLKSSVKVSGLKDLLDFVHEDEQIKK